LNLFIRSALASSLNIIELKAVSALTDEHRAQLLNYLHATGLELGLLVNFGHYPGLEYERIAKNAAHKNENGLFRCVSLIHSR
jgi:GxxExxY protein